MSIPTYQLEIVRGKTLEHVFLYSDSKLKYVTINSIVIKAPLTLACPSHGIPPSWPVKIQSVIAPSQINTEGDSYVMAYPTDPDTVEINSIDASPYLDHDGTGYLVFNPPMDLVGWNFRMHVRDNIGGNLLLSLSSIPADGADGEIEIDLTGSSFMLKLTALQTEAITWSGGVYDIEAIRPDGGIVPVIGPSAFIVNPEVTVWD